jgi:hypothetical protein
MIKPDCPSYVQEIDIECVDAQFNAVRHQIICGIGTFDLDTTGLGDIDSDGCEPTSFLGFVGTIRPADVNDATQCISPCECQVNCLPPPPPPPIPIPQAARGLQGINLNGGNLIKEFAIFDTFEVSSYSTQSVITTRECANDFNNFTPVNINFAPIDYEPYCYDTVSIVSDIQIVNGHLIITKNSLKILSINNPIVSVNVDTINSCDFNVLIDNDPGPPAVSVDSCSTYDGSEELNLITDVYIENNTLKYRIANIRVLKIHSVNNQELIITTTDCPAFLE